VKRTSLKSEFFFSGT